MDINEFVKQHRYAMFNEDKTILASSNDLIWMDRFIVQFGIEHNEHVYLYDYDKNAIIKEYDPATDIS